MRVVARRDAGNARFVDSSFPGSTGFSRPATDFATIRRKNAGDVYCAARQTCSKETPSQKKAGDTARHGWPDESDRE